jgi:hypothetical protein
MFKKLLALIIAVIILFACLCGCNNIVIDESGSQTEAPSETFESKVEFNDGKPRLFANKKYQCKIIRPKIATSQEVEISRAIRDLLKDITGITPTMSTDANTTKLEPNEFALLIGNTNYEESSTVYSTLGYGDFKAELVNTDTLSPSATLIPPTPLWQNSRDFSKAI